MKYFKSGRFYAKLKSAAFFLILISLSDSIIAQSEVLKWMDGKTSAISITFDGGTINQFKVALPILNEFNMPATFYIVTGDIKDAKHRGEFIGRSVFEIIEEAKSIKTNRDNLFERAVAIRYLESSDGRLHHTRAGDLFELGRVADACREIDAAFAKYSRGDLKKDMPGNLFHNPDVDISWDELKVIEADGHEFGSHSVTHPQLGIYDTENMKYELLMAKEEIEENLGRRHTFSAEIPHGIENPRVMEFANRYIPTLRNRLSLPYLQEINRWSRVTPYGSGRHYIQWQRGPRSSTSLDIMKSWADTCMKYNNVWLVLTFHGIDGIGYEPKTSADFRSFVSYVNENKDKFWIATFQDVVKYIKIRMASSVTQMVETLDVEGDRTEIMNTDKVPIRIFVALRNNLDKEIYNTPLTLKTYLPPEWKDATIVYKGEILPHKTGSDKNGKYVIYNTFPNTTSVIISRR